MARVKGRLRWGGGGARVSFFLTKNPNLKKKIIFFGGGN